MNYKMEIAQLVVVILVVCEAVKRAGLRGKYVPFLAVILAIGGAFYFEGANFLSTLTGVLLGFATSGAYGAFKGLTKKE